MKLPNAAGGRSDALRAIVRREYGETVRELSRYDARKSVCALFDARKDEEESLLSFERVTQLLAESEEVPRRVNVVRLLKKIVEVRRESSEKEEKKERVVGTAANAESSSARERKSRSEKRAVSSRKSAKEEASKKSEHALFADVSNATEEREKCSSERKKRASEIESENVMALQSRVEKAEEKVRKLRNGEAFKLLRERMLTREEKLKSRLKSLEAEVEWLKEELVERDAEIIRERRCRMFN